MVVAQGVRWRSPCARTLAAHPVRLTTRMAANRTRTTTLGDVISGVRFMTVVPRGSGFEWDDPILRAFEPVGTKPSSGISVNALSDTAPAWDREKDTMVGANGGQIKAKCKRIKRLYMIS